MGAQRGFARKLLDYLHQNQNEMVELLIALAEAESPSHIPESQQRVQAILKSKLQSLGMRVSHIPGNETGGHLLAEASRKDTRPVQLLLGHCDTVWPLGTLEKMPVRREQDKLYGPGVYDMKAGLVQSIFALRAIQTVGLSLEVSPVFLINSDEEIGSRESGLHIQKLAGQADRTFVTEPSLGPEGKLKTARKGVGRFTVHVQGRASHAGLAPEAGASAILELSHVIQRLFELNDSERNITVNVGTIDGGLRPNVVAPESKAVADVRVATHEDADAVTRAIYGMQPVTPGTSLRVEGGMGRPPMEHTPGNRLLWELACEAADELQLRITEGMAGGGSDGNTTSLLTPTLDGLGAVGDGAHAITEFVHIPSLTERAALLARLLLFPPLSPDSA